MKYQLTLPNHPACIGPATDFAYKWGLRNGLNKKAAQLLGLATSEIVTDIVRFAYRYKVAEFDVSFLSADTHVEVIIHELGEPFDPDQHQYKKKAAIEKLDFEGAGLRIARRAVDDFLFINKGKEGIEFRLVQKKNAFEDPSVKNWETKIRPPEEDVTYSVDFATYKDAEDISKLIYRTYDLSYHKEIMYYPQKISADLAYHQKFAVIARTPQNEAVGYFAIVFTTDSYIGEVGEAVVDLSHRKKGLMKIMLSKLIDLARMRRMYGVFGEANSAHDFSQRANAHFGMKSTAVLLALSVALDVQGISKAHTGQDVTVIIEYLPLRRPSIELEVYLPAPYRKLLLDIYSTLEIQVRNMRVKNFIPSESTQTDVHIFYDSRSSVIVVNRYGLDFSDSVDDAVEDLEQNKIQTIYIDLPLHNPGTKVYTKLLRQKGFIFSGLMPAFHKEKDYFRMQRIKSKLDLDLVITYSPMAKKLLRRIKKEWNENKEEKK